MDYINPINKRETNVVYSYFFGALLSSRLPTEHHLQKGVETPLITVQLHELETFTSTDCNNCFEKAASFVKKVHIYVVLKPLSHARGVIIERQYICMRAERFSDDSCEFSRLMESFTELMGAVENNHSFGRPYSHK